MTMLLIFPYYISFSDYRDYRAKVSTSVDKFCQLFHIHADADVSARARIPIITAWHLFPLPPTQYLVLLKYYEVTFTGCKWSLEQGNVFTPVSQSFCPRGGGVCLWIWGVSTTPPPLDTPTPMDTQPPAHTPTHWTHTSSPPGLTHTPLTPSAIGAGGTHPTGMHSCWQFFCHKLYTISLQPISFEASNLYYRRSLTFEEGMIAMLKHRTWKESCFLKLNWSSKISGKLKIGLF